jgi:SAM-dependent methyltransferase
VTSAKRTVRNDPPSQANLQGRSAILPALADFPFPLPTPLAERLAGHLDREAKIPRALDDLGPVAGRDVALVDGGRLRAAQLEARGARVTLVPSAAQTGLDDAVADVLVALWDGFDVPTPEEIDEARRILRPGGRVLVVHDYGRDDVSRLRPADLPAYGRWSRRDGPFLSTGWKIRVVHAWWTFDSLEEAAAFLGEAFGSLGSELAAGLRRPRLSYNIAIYHRTAGAAA